LLDELEVRFEDEEDPEVEKILQQFGFVRGVGYLQSFAKQEIRIFSVKHLVHLVFLQKSSQMIPKALWPCRKERIVLRALHDWKEAARVIELLLDQTKPYRKQILKRSELMNCILVGLNVITLSRTGLKENLLSGNSEICRFSKG
jgi:hypothetical protein